MGHTASDDIAEARTGITRRQALTMAAQAGAALSGAALVSACGSASSTSAVSRKLPSGLAALPGGNPVRGGTFTAGAITLGSAETLFPGTSSGVPDYIRDFALYNTLFYPGVNILPQEPGLALSAESNSDATVWTIHLRDGVLWHDGTSFTADDVVYNFTALWSDPNSNYAASFFTGLVDYRAIRKRDDLTVEVPLLTPCAQFPTILAYFNFGIVKSGATVRSIARHAIGTGPFKLVSFTPGSQSVMEANREYWETGKPYVDRLVVDSSFTDNTSIMNAMLAGDLNLFPSLPLLTAREQLTSHDVQILQAPLATQNYVFGMRVDKGPFADNRVRTAFKLLVNRQELIDSALAGFGTVTYDTLAPGTQYYASDLSRAQDVERARSLFKAAGAEGATYPWPSAEAFPGQIESATVFAEQAKAAGVTVKVQETSAATYFTPAGHAYTRYSCQNVFQPVTSLMVDYRAVFTGKCPYPDTHWGSQPGGAAAQALISEAVAETNPARAEQLWHECQVQQFEQGGYVGWGAVPYVDAAAKKVRGLKAGAGFNFNNWRLQDGWLE